MNIMSGGWENCERATHGEHILLIDNGVLETQSGAASYSKLHFYFPVYPGQITSVSAKVRTLDGVFGLAVDYFGSSGASLGNGGNTLVTSSPSFRRVELTSQAIKGAAYARAVFGQWSALTGHSFAKEPAILVKAGPTAVSSLGYALIMFRPGEGWAIRSDFTNNLISGVTWEAANKRLALECPTWTHKNRKPLVLCSDAADSIHSLTAKSLRTSTTSYIRWFDSSGVAVDVEALDKTVFAYVLMVV